MRDKPMNALAELAERLDTLCKEDGHRFFPTASDRDDIRKAVRIVAELAKVREWFIETANKQGNDGKVGCHYFKTRCYIAFKECRAIAEEGAEDVK